LYQQQRVAAGELDRSLAYWTAKLDGADHRFQPGLLAPVDGDRWGVDAAVTVELPADLTERLRIVASSVSATPFMLAFAAWAAVLAQLDPHAASDLVIGVPVDGRTAMAVQDLVGLFVTMVPVRINVDTDLTATEFLLAVRDSLLEAYAHADIPLEWIVRSVAPARGTGRVPLLDVSCQLQHHADGDRRTIGPLRVEPLDPAPQQAKFQLALNAIMTGTGTRLHIAYPEERFARSAVAALGAHLRETLALIVDAPGTRLSDLPVFPAQPRSAPATASRERPASPPRATGPAAADAATDAATVQDIADLFAETLGRAGVAATDDFFAIGGHSLLALHVMRRLRDRVGEHLPMNLLFTHPTPRALASALAAGDAPVRAAGGPDVRHDVGLRLGPLPARVAVPPAAALITGVTGLLGAHLLAEVLERTSITPWCLIRAGDPDTARQRAESALRGIGRWRPGWHRWIRVLVGDLSRPMLGLPEREYADAAAAVDLVFHVAASTHLLDSYASLRGPNVIGTREVLWFATTGSLKPVHYVSTVSTMRGDASSPPALPEDWHTDPALLPDDGYVRSKWVAEETVRQAGRLGVPATVYRPSRICGGAGSGPPPAADAFWNFVVACIEIGAEPTGDGWSGFSDNLVPADFLATVLVRTALAGGADGATFNLVNAASTRLAEVLDVARAAGHRIDRVPGDAWQRSLERAVADPQRRSRAQESALLLTQTVLARGPGHSRPVDTARADAALAALGIAGPRVDAALLASHLAALADSGRLASHAARGEAAGPADAGAAPATLPELWDRAVRTWPRRPAAIDAHETVTFAELDRRAAAIAAGLAARGVSAGDRVGIRLPHDVALLATLLAVVRLGAAFVPVDHRHDDERSRGTLRRAGVRLTVAGAPAGDDATVSPAVLLRAGHDLPAPLAAAGDVAYVLYTSGSTGTPKGVVVPHTALARYLAWVRAEYCGAGGAGAPLYSSVAFDLTITSLFGPLVSGGAVHLVDPRNGIVRVAEMLCEGSTFDFVKLTPTHLRILLDQLRGRRMAGHVAALVIGGEALPADLVQAWREVSPRTVVHNEYGPTEATVGCCVHRLDPDAAVPRPFPIGTPIPGVRLRVVDGAGREAAAGELGELAIGGGSLAWGYDADPPETARRFVPDAGAAAAGARSYRTGDLVRRDADGTYYYHGRTDNQVKIRGHRVETDEVAAALRGLDGVDEAVVRSVGSGDGAGLVGYVTGATLSASDADGLRARLRRLVPDYMVPTDLLVVGAVPTTINGKVDLAALPAPPRLTSGSGVTGR
jgi:amino acid adenylation domain-containing protein/thioester reductase-like protein